MSYSEVILVVVVVVEVVVVVVAVSVVEVVEVIKVVVDIIDEVVTVVVVEVVVIVVAPLVCPDLMASEYHVFCSRKKIQRIFHILTLTYITALAFFSFRAN